MNPLPSLACQFNSLKWTIYTVRKTLIFRTVGLILIVQPDIIFTVINTDKKRSFLSKIYKSLKKLTHFRPGALWTGTYYFEYIAQRNNIKTSYYVQRMTEHYFRSKIPINSNQTQLQVLAPRSNPGVHMDQSQLCDVTAGLRAHTSDVTFSKFQFQSTCYEW